MINILYSAERDETFKHISNMHQVALQLIDKQNNKEDLLIVAKNLGEYASIQCKNKYSSLGIYYNKAFIVALLYNIIDNDNLSIDDLISKGINDNEILNAIETLKEKSDEEYFDYIKRIYFNDISRLVKIFDLENNMDIKKINILSNETINKINKYWWSWKFLKNEISEETAYNNIKNGIV